MGVLISHVSISLENLMEQLPYGAAAFVAIVVTILLFSGLAGSTYLAVVGRVLARRRAIGEIATSPPMTADEANFAIKLSRLLDTLDTALPSEVPESAAEIERLRPPLESLQAHLQHAKFIGPETNVPISWVMHYVRSRGWRVGWAACIRWSAIRRFIDEANSLVSHAEWLTHRGKLNIADPKTAEAELTDTLQRPPLWAIVRHVDVWEQIAHVDLLAPVSTVPVTLVRQHRGRGGKIRVTEVDRKPHEINHDYAAQVLRHAREAVHMSFSCVPGLKRVVISIYTSMVHPTRGNTYMGAIFSAAVERNTWDQIVHEAVSSENAFKNFQFNYKPDKVFNLTEVPPLRLRSFTAAASFEAVQPSDLDPLEFERLVCDLLRGMGYMAELTKASHDGGIDIEAINPQPVVGGKLIVQCKRYQGTVGAPAVRDLFGVVMANNATKGILITTSAFSPDAIAFAHGRQQLELIDGPTLVSLLDRYRVGLRPGSRTKSLETSAPDGHGGALVSANETLRDMHVDV
jgi:Restriction endonuclease